MLGLVLADNIFLLYIFWELTSLSSYLLIGFEHQHAPARHAALQALLVTSAGGLALLAGVVLLGHAGGTLNFSTLLVSSEPVRSHALYVPISLLILAGAFTKPAQMPFHFWLSNAMEAPTPVSAYLHAAAMVKAGIYLLARCSPILGGTIFWQYSLTAVGTGRSPPLLQALQRSPWLASHPFWGLSARNWPMRRRCKPPLPRHC